MITTTEIKKSSFIHGKAKIISQRWSKSDTDWIEIPEFYIKMTVHGHLPSEATKRNVFLWIKSVLSLGSLGSGGNYWFRYKIENLTNNQVLYPGISKNILHGSRTVSSSGAQLGDNESIISHTDEKFIVVPDSWQHKEIRVSIQVRVTDTCTLYINRMSMTTNSKWNGFTTSLLKVEEHIYNNSQQIGENIEITY